MISTGTGSGLLPWNTVHATPFNPGFNALSGKRSTLPAFGAIVIFGMPPWGVAAIPEQERMKQQITARENIPDVQHYDVVRVSGAEVQPK